MKTIRASDWTGQPDPGERRRAEPVDVWKSRKFIKEHATEELSLTEVARAVNISAGHLSEKFRQVTGVNFVDYVARVRFEQACRFLRETDDAISEIAFRVGFQSLSQFNRVFKKLSGKSPSTYRRAVIRQETGLASKKPSRTCMK